MVITYQSVLLKGETECDWDTSYQMGICLDFISTYLGNSDIYLFKNFITDAAGEEMYHMKSSPFENGNNRVSLALVRHEMIKENLEDSVHMIENITGWNENKTFNLVLSFLEQHCPEMVEKFETNVQQIIIDETSGALS